MSFIASGLTPNAGQAAAISGLLDYIVDHNDKPWCAVLEGHAGTGKTFTVAEVIRRLLDDDHLVGLLAPTHKARGAALDALAKFGIEQERLTYCGTVAAAVGKTPATDDPPPEDEIKAEFVITGRVPAELAQCDVVFVDEVSMIDVQDVKRIRNVCQGMKVILVGDFAQIPPVRGQSVVDLIGKAKLRYSLREIMRASDGSNITLVANALRSREKLCMESVKSGADVLMYDSRAAWVEAFCETKGSVAIAYRNERVNELNDAKRRRLYGDDPAQYVLGEEVLVSNQPITRWRPGVGREVFAYVSQPLRIVGVHGLNETFSVDHADTTAEMALLTLENDDQGQMQVYACLPDRLAPGTDLWDLLMECRKVVMEVANVCKHHVYDSVLPARAWSRGAVALLSQFYKHGEFDREGNFVFRDSNATRLRKAAWGIGYYGVMEQIAALAHSHAITAHKSQGSTYAHVFVDWADIETCKDPETRRALKYVGVSRASQKVHLITR